MDYELVQLNKKRVAGIRIRTDNNDANMSNQIGRAWQRFFGEGIFASISSKKNDKTIGLYTNYENGVSWKYDVMICCEVEDNAIMPAQVEVETIGEGKYAKFVVKGHVQKAVQEFWMKLWAMDLDRKYSCDFEEYQAEGDMENGEIHFYISLNEKK
ncbi:bacterial transcription activator, effector binding domain [Anaerotignum neopropionicum]|uniref:Bacterial transcription activator, effector binding domain n=1 Tax=Anaerotignum neopropionicum TaxID=36847 RepID=A0A136WFE1_9FIRM|nr:GyrI-like domain-containing protein [Anaerotignum neopropionicum]KXL53231.1 bacterial transcription activator, effector binding domain [Anaerotignum neopropionicum]